MTTARDVIDAVPSVEEEIELAINWPSYAGKTTSEKAKFILAALEAAGKKVVDREPTLEMIDAARTAYFGCGGVCNPKPWWCAMWDAAERRKEP